LRRSGIPIGSARPRRAPRPLSGTPVSTRRDPAASALDPDGQLSQSEEAELYRHYGMQYSEARSSTGLPEGGAGSGTTTGEPVGRDVSGPTTDDAMTRSEEELRVGTADPRPAVPGCASTWSRTR
jgi:hypothetical protein